MLKKLILITIVVAVVVVAAGFSINNHMDKPKFCGSCHIMKKPFNTWQKSNHQEASCVDCHYAPGKAHTIKARFKGLSQMFSYLGSDNKDGEVRKRTVIADSSCTTSACHPYEKFENKRFIFTKDIPFIHKTHEEKTIEGQKLHCSTCHVHLTADKHFEVPKETCYLCHFKNTEFNQGRSRCTLCHKIPTKSLQSQKSERNPDEKPITHQTLEKAQVPCNSCHYELVQGKGEIKEEACLECHDSEETLQKATEKKLMHEKHVAESNANCLNCHEPIQHKEIDFLSPIRENCSICHPDHHLYQKLLLLGAARDDVAAMPGHMVDVRTNCLGCHTESTHDDKGQEVISGSGKACVDCHTPRHDKMLENWKAELKEEVTYAQEVEKEAETAITDARAVWPEEELNSIVENFRKGQESLRIVEYGNGVHNKKYSIMLIDAALEKFDNVLFSLQKD